MIDTIYEWAWWYITQPWVWIISLLSVAFDIAVICGVVSLTRGKEEDDDWKV